MGYVLEEGPQKATVDHITLDVEGTAVPAYHARPDGEALGSDSVRLSTRGSPSSWDAQFPCGEWSPQRTGITTAGANQAPQ